MNIPTALTLSRIALVPVIIYFNYLPQYRLVTVILFGVAALSDWLDGYLARKLNQLSDLGKYLDPLADKLLVISLLIVFAVQLKVEVFSVLIFTAREFAVMGLRIAAASKNEILAASYTAKVKTVLQMAAIVLILLEWPFGLVLYYLALIVALVSMGEYFWQNRKYLKG